MSRYAGPLPLVDRQNREVHLRLRKLELGISRSQASHEVHRLATKLLEPAPKPICRCALQREEGRISWGWLKTRHVDKRE